MHGSDFEKRGEDKIKEAVKKHATTKESTKIIVKQMTPHQLRQAYIKAYIKVHTSDLLPNNNNLTCLLHADDCSRRHTESALTNAVAARHPIRPTPEPAAVVGVTVANSAKRVKLPASTMKKF